MGGSPLDQFFFREAKFFSAARRRRKFLGFGGPQMRLPTLEITRLGTQMGKNFRLRRAFFSDASSNTIPVLLFHCGKGINSIIPSRINIFQSRRDGYTDDIVSFCEDYSRVYTFANLYRFSYGAMGTLILIYHFC